MIYSFCHIGALSRYERSDLMSAKRRDNRNRILRNGESQRKDGRYICISTLIMQEMQNMCIAGS